MDSPPPPRLSPVGPPIAVVATVISWAGAFPAIGVALRDFAPLPLASVRFTLASVFAAAWLVWKRPPRLRGRDYLRAAVSGVLGTAAYTSLLNVGQATVSPGAASFIIGTQPLFIALLAVLIYREPFNRWSWAGAALGAAGVATVASGQPGGLTFGAGSTYIVSAAICAAFYAILQRPLYAKSDPLSITAVMMIAGAVALLPWLPGGFRQAAAADVPALTAVAFLAIAPTVVGYSCWTYVLKSFGPARAGQFLYLVAPTATLLTWAMLGDPPRWTTIVGGTMALGGVVIVNTLGRRGK